VSATRASLESALAMPEAAFAGQLLHPTLPEQAAAYLFHLVAVFFRERAKPVSSRRR
jgi:hypothetical protein